MVTKLEEYRNNHSHTYIEVRLVQIITNNVGEMFQSTHLG